MSRNVRESTNILYRARKPREVTSSRPTPPRALRPEEKAEVRAVLNGCQAAYEVRHRKSFPGLGYQSSRHEQLVTLADRYRINIYIADGPLYEGFYENKGLQKHLSEVQRELDRFAEQSGYVHHLAAGFAFPSHQMKSADHVRHLSAERYTQTLTLEIKFGRVAARTNLQGESQ